jgi:hypothetical protein
MNLSFVEAIGNSPSVAVLLLLGLLYITLRYFRLRQSRAVSPLQCPCCFQSKSCFCGCFGADDPTDTKPGCHFRGGSKLHVEQVLSRTKDSLHRRQGIVFLIHGMLSSGRSFSSLAYALAEEVIQQVKMAVCFSVPFYDFRDLTVTCRIFWDLGAHLGQDISHTR